MPGEVRLSPPPRCIWMSFRGRGRGGGGGRGRGRGGRGGGSFGGYDHGPPATVVGGFNIN